MKEMINFKTAIPIQIKIHECDLVENTDIESESEAFSGDNEVVTTGQTRSLRDRSITTGPKCFDDVILAAAEKIDNPNKPFKEPSTFKEAMDSPDKHKWLEAIQSEMTSLNVNETWDLVDLPKGRKPLPCKWVFKVKMNHDGSVDRYKARMVIKGYSQQQGVDYYETFSSVVHMSTVRAFLAIAAQEN